MKCRYFLFAVWLLAGSCQSSKKAANATQTDTYDVALTARTRLFLSELKNEEAQAKNAHKAFVPSASLIKNYQLTRRDDQYFVSGFIEAEGNIDSLQMTRAGITLQSSSTKLHTVVVDLSAINSLLHWPNIKSFSISTPLSPLK